MKRLLYLTHRWLGIVAALFMAMWFVSGVVMMYVGYPKLTQNERLAHLPELSSRTCCVGLDAALRAVGIAEPNRVRLTTIAGVPHYVVAHDKKALVSINATTGARVRPVSAVTALEAAQAFAGDAPVRYLDLIGEDAWTHSRALDVYRPLHRIEIANDERTWLYVASTTGEVVRDASRLERGWNWVGAWIHWLYPLRGGSLDKFWHDIMVYTSVGATVLAFSGLVVGVLRWRFSGRYKNGAHTPYRQGFTRWHHWLGLGFGLFALTWIFSGLMSVNPWKVFDSGAAQLDEHAYAGGVLNARAFPEDMTVLFSALQAAGMKPREIEWRQVGGHAYWVAYNERNQTRVVASRAPAQPQMQLPAPLLEAAGARLLPGARPLQSEWLAAHDLYYYARAPHTMGGHIDKRLPVLRLKFGDPHATWVHIDPYTGAVINKLDTRKRISRWLFAFLHSWDWLPLLENRPLWDGILIVLSLGGLLVSGTGIVLGWRRLGQTLARRQRQSKPKPQAA